MGCGRWRRETRTIADSSRSCSDWQIYGASDNRGRPWRWGKSELGSRSEDPRSGGRNAPQVLGGVLHAYKVRVWELCGSCVRGLPVDMLGTGVSMYPGCPELAGDAPGSCDILSDALDLKGKREPWSDSHHSQDVSSRVDLSSRLWTTSPRSVDSSDQQHVTKYVAGWHKGKFFIL